MSCPWALRRRARVLEAERSRCRCVLCAGGLVVMTLNIFTCSRDLMRDSDEGEEERGESRQRVEAGCQEGQDGRRCRPGRRRRGSRRALHGRYIALLSST